MPFSIMHFLQFSTGLTYYAPNITISAGIKTGRYTYEKRTKDILELKKIKKDVCEARNVVLMREKEERAVQLADRIMAVRNKHTKQNVMDQAMNKLAKYLVC